MMPGIITKYLLKELGRSFSMVLCGLTCFFLLVGVAQEAIREGLGPQHVLQLLPYVLPNALVFAIPATWLWAVSAVYGRFAADHELTALRSSGVSPWRVIWPSYVLGLTLSLITVGMYEVGATWGHNGAQQVIIHALDEIALGALRRDRAVTMDQFSAAVRDVRDRTLIQPVFTIYPSGDGPQVNIVAEEAEFELDSVGNHLIVIFRRGEITTSTGETLRFDDELRHEISLGAAFSGGDYQSDSPAHRAMATIPDDIIAQRNVIENAQAELAAEVGFALLLGQQDVPLTPVATELPTKVKDGRNRLARLSLEPQRRWATGFSCLAFVLIGAPMSLRLKNADFVSSFFICFLPILLIYYPFFMFSLDRAKAGDLPPVTTWVANVIVAVWGLWLLRRVVTR